MLGVISYEIPKDWKELEIHFSPNVWRSKKFIFVATNPKHAKQQVEDEVEVEFLREVFS